MDSNKNPLNVVFLGRSGSGKGTQAELLFKKIESKSGAGSVFCFATGDCFRSIIKQSELLTGKLIDSKIIKMGAKGPDFFTIWCWSKEFIYNVKEDQHVILDGTPRTVLEAKVLDEMLEFYNRNNVFPVWLDVGYDWAYDRLMGRGRFDDIPETIKNRLAYYPKYVEPSIEYFKKESANKIIRINGEQSIEDVHKDIMKALEYDNN